MDCLSQLFLFMEFSLCILKQMKETFETNLSSSQKEEMANQKAYEELKAAKDIAFSEVSRFDLEPRTSEPAPNLCVFYLFSCWALGFF